MATDSNPYPKNTGSLQALVADNGSAPLTFLLASGYVWSADHQFLSDITGELSGSGYARVVGDNVEWTTDDDESVLSVDDPVFAAFTATGVDALVAFFDTGSAGTSKLAFHNLLPAIDVTAEPLTCDLPTEGALVLTTAVPTGGTPDTSGADPGDVYTVVTPGDPAEFQPPTGGSGYTDYQVYDETGSGSSVTLDLSGLGKAVALVAVEPDATVTLDGLPANTGWAELTVVVVADSGTVTLDCGTEGLASWCQNTVVSGSPGAAMQFGPTGPGWSVTSTYPSAGGGAVDSVNGETGVVVLTADDIADGTSFKAYPAADKTKLAAITGTNTGDQTITLTGDITGSGTGSFATAIASGVIVNADINASAAIALSKLATDPLARANHTGTQTASTISDFATAWATERAKYTKPLRKLSDQTKNANTTLSDITDLGFSIAASEVWICEGVLHIASVNVTADLDIAVTLPSGATLGPFGAYSSRGTDSLISNPPSINTAGSRLSLQIFGQAGPTVTQVHYWFSVVNSTNAGTVQLQFSQGTSNATDTTVKAGSTLIADRIP